MNSFVMMTIVMIVPLVSKLNAPLKAELDISVLTRQIRGLLKAMINETIISIIPKVVSKYMSVEMERIEEMVRMTRDSLNQINTTFNGRIKQLEEQVGQCRNTCSLAESNTSIIRSPVEPNETIAPLNLNETFLVIFHQGWGSINQYRLLVASQEKQLANITYFTRDTVFHEFPLNPENYVYDLDDTAMRMTTSGKLDAGAQLETQTNATNVYGFIFQKYVCEGFYVIPSKYLSSRYIVASFDPFKRSFHYKSIFALSPLFDDTNVDIYIVAKKGKVTFDSKTYSNKDFIRIQLRKHETLQISHQYDLSGTLITSSKPIAVVSGNTCNTITDHSNCQPFSEMLLPTNQYDNKFFVPKLASRRTSTLRLFVNEDDTMVSISDMNKQVQRSLNSLQFIDFQSSSMVQIRSNKNISVVMFPHEINNVGDSFMMIVPGTNQYLNSYDFVIPPYSHFKNYVAVTVKATRVNGLILDDLKLDVSGGSVAFGEYASLTVSIEPGFHNMKHRNGVTFGLWLYGESRNDGYGFPAGVAYRDQNF